MDATPNKGIILQRKSDDRRHLAMARPGKRYIRAKIQPQINILHKIAFDRIRKWRRHIIISKTDKFVAKVNIVIINQVVSIECRCTIVIFADNVDKLRSFEFILKRPGS